AVLFTAPRSTELFSLSLHDALPILAALAVVVQGLLGGMRVVLRQDVLAILHGCLAQAFFALLAVIVLLTSARTRAPLARVRAERSEEHTSELQSRSDLVCRLLLEKK